MKIVHLSRDTEMNWYEKGIIIPTTKDLWYMRDIVRNRRGFSSRSQLKGRVR
jgi:hypothetical protein